MVTNNKCLPGHTAAALFARKQNRKPINNGARKRVPQKGSEKRAGWMKSVFRGSENDIKKWPKFGVPKGSLNLFLACALGG